MEPDLLELGSVDCRAITRGRMSVTRADAKKEAATILIGVLRQNPFGPDPDQVPSSADRDKIAIELSNFYRYLERIAMNDRPNGKDSE